MKAKTHEENRSKVCVLCLKKVNLRIISANVRQIIKVRYIPDLDEKSWYYPTCICSHCSIIIYTSESKGKENQKIELFPYKFNITRRTRSGNVCTTS